MRAKILVTTSHRPTQRVRSFIKDLASVLPEAIKLNRGKSSLRDLYYDAMAYGATRIVIVTVWKGNPGKMLVYQPLEPPDVGLKLIASYLIRGVKLRREVPGSKKLQSTTKLAIDLTSINSERLRMLADTISRSFLARMVFDPDELEHFNVVLELEEAGSTIVLKFISPRDNRVCGPIIRIQGVRDYVSGFSISGGEARGSETSTSDLQSTSR